MRLKEIEINNFRSIIHCKLEISGSNNVILGKNNSGKSNILNSINDSLLLILNHDQSIQLKVNETFYRFNNYFYTDRKYKHDSDFHLGDKQEIYKFRIAFSLEDSEVKQLDFKGNHNYMFTHHLEFLIEYYEKNRYKIKVKTNSAETGRFIENPAKTMLVCDFLNSIINVDYIPAIRTEDNINELIRALVDEKLNQLSDEDSYKAAYEAVRVAEEEKLKEISQYLNRKLSEYLPNIESVKIQSSTYRSNRRNQYRFLINDGVETDITRKGDGIKSLVAMSLLQQQNSNKYNILLIDEPEAHLHSGAIKELKDTLYSNNDESISFISTHSAIFVNRNYVGSNYIIENGFTNQCNHINDVRSVLGISASENLLNANLVILVEGVTDREVLVKMMQLTNEFKQCLENETVVIKEMGGINNLDMLSKLYNSILVDYFIIVDKENNSKVTIQNLVRGGNFENTKVLYCDASSTYERELENLIDDRIVIDSIEKVFGVNLKGELHKHINLRFKEQIKKLLGYKGIIPTDEQINQLKVTIVHEIVKFQDLTFLNETGRTFLTNITERIIHKL